MALDRRALAIAIVLLMSAVILTAGRMQWHPAPLITAASLGGTVALILTLGIERGGIVALLVTATLNRYTAEIAGVSLKPEHIAAPLVALALLPQARQLITRFSLPSWLLLCWAGWSVIGGLLNAPDTADSTRLWVMLMLVIFPFFVLVGTVRSSERLWFAVDSWMLVGIAAAVFGLASHLLFAWEVNLGIQINPVTNDPTVPSTFRESNLFGSAMMMLSLATISLITFGARSRPIIWVAALAGILGMQVSFTRTAWLAFIGGLVLLVIVRAVMRPLVSAPEERPAIPLRAFGTLAAATVIGTVVLWAPVGDPDVAAERAGREAARATARNLHEATVSAAEDEAAATPTTPLLTEGEPTAVVVPTPVPANPDIVGRVGSITDATDSSVRIRIEFAKQGLRDWVDYPIAGGGIGSFGQKYISSSQDRAWLSNVFVRVLHDSGTVGLALFLAPMAILAWQAIRLITTMRDDVDRLTVSLAIAVAGMFVAFQATEGLQLAWYWFAVGLFAAALEVSRRQRASVTESA